MAAIILRKRLGGALEPIDDEGREVLSKIAAGDLVKADIKRPRNIHFHRKFFAMLKLVLDNQEAYKSTDDLLDVCKLRIGHVRVIQTKHGEVRVPASISFASMDESEFSQFYDKAVNWVCSEVIPGLKRAELNAETEEELRAFAA